jgi:2-keto-4-pentenoate hydratase/2-oxohepta-3-ene-1,7-dioic acid hydratase in catechol pathway
MKFVTFEQNGTLTPGVLRGDEVVSLAPAGFSSLLDVIGGGDAALAKASAAAASGPGLPLNTVSLRAPIARPGKIICIGLNYRDHAIESNLPIPTIPVVFTKYSNTVIGPGDAIVLPKVSEKPDYEAEFGVVIGKRGRHITEENWKNHVFGYTIVNDVSARDYQLATSQWTIGKTFDTFCPFGPSITTADEIADPHNLSIGIEVSGEVLQNSSTKELIFGIPYLIHYLSTVMTLEPGDLISTGTPPGVGMARKPPRWLRPGDDCVVKIEGLGELRNPVVAEA